MEKKLKEFLEVIAENQTALNEKLNVITRNQDELAKAIMNKVDKIKIKAYGKKGEL